MSLQEITQIKPFKKFFARESLIEDLRLILGLFNRKIYRGKGCDGGIFLTILARLKIGINLITKSYNTS